MRDKAAQTTTAGISRKARSPPKSTVPLASSTADRSGRPQQPRKADRWLPGSLSDDRSRAEKVRDLEVCSRSWQFTASVKAAPSVLTHWYWCTLKPRVQSSAFRLRIRRQLTPQAK